METEGKWVQQLYCHHCEWKWWPRKDSPTLCPHCHSAYWRTPPTQRGHKKRGKENATNGKN